MYRLHLIKIVLKNQYYQGFKGATVLSIYRIHIGYMQPIFF
nr:MAG TPA: hypothetical protein [Caudoviricetes sp.]